MDGADLYYVATRENLLRTLREPSGVRAGVRELDGVAVESVLDVGCGIGQALLPLAVRRGARGVGVDPSARGLRMGRKLYASRFPDASVDFVQARAESLPFASESFDLVHCGLALPYMDNARALGEMARVLRRGGFFLLQIHHARYYFRRIREGVTGLDPAAIFHGARVLATGALHHLTGRQPRRWPFDENFQTRWLLGRMLARHGLRILRERAESNPLTPAFVIRKG